MSIVPSEYIIRHFCLFLYVVLPTHEINMHKKTHKHISLNLSVLIIYDEAEQLAVSLLSAPLLLHLCFSFCRVRKCSYVTYYHNICYFEMFKEKC